MGEGCDSLIRAACIPMPIQVVIDDVGWWSGRDGHEENEPFRTGICRDHVVADYEAIVRLGRELGMRPQAAMVLCEWDVEGACRRVPSATWMGADWENGRWQGPWLEAAAEVLRGQREYVELALHGVGHEYWAGGVMERAEWHDTEGRMRPREEVERHLALFADLWEQHGLGPRPESFVPAAFLHRFGGDEEGLAAILRDWGIRYISTPFGGMHMSRQPECAHYGLDGGLMTVDRGRDLLRWLDLGGLGGDGRGPGRELAGPVCGMHWPNLLHQDPERNGEVVDGWVAFLAPYGRRLDRMLAPNTEAFCRQLVYYDCGKAEVRGDEVHIGFPAAGVKPAHGAGAFVVHVEVAERVVGFEADGMEVVSVEEMDRGDGVRYAVKLRERGGEAAGVLRAAK